jgi:translation initiation factor 1 (eIF-1/SUI1)
LKQTKISPKLQALLRVARQVQQGGKEVTCLSGLLTKQLFIS